jgi:hypothetical protein
MGLFTKNPDLISDRSRELNSRIAALESKIKKLDRELRPSPSRVRPSPEHRENIQPPQPGVPCHQSTEPIFERVDRNQLKVPAENPPNPGHFNELGVRKYDLLSLLDRIKKQFQAPPVANPKLVNYLASGSIQGLRPLRYEKRVARNRFIALTAFFLLAVLGILSYALEHHRH